MKKSIAVNMLIIILIIIISLLINNLLNSKPYVEICYESGKSGIMQVYYDKGNGFNEITSERKYYGASKNKSYINFNIEKGNYKNLRLDPLDQGDLNIKIYSIRLISGNTSKLIMNKDLTELKGFNNYNWESGVLSINDKNTLDSQIILNYDEVIIINNKISIYVILGILISILFILLKKYVLHNFLIKNTWIVFSLFICYFIITQYSFILRTDVYAEAFPQYIYDFKDILLYKVIEFNNYAYLGILPSLITYIYLLLDFPIGYADYFFKIITLLFVFISLYFVFSIKTNNLFFNPVLKILFSILVISFLDFTIFSFINIWYVGFLSVIFISLSLIDIKEKSILFFYTVFSSLVILSKPPLFIVPIILYALYNRKNIIPNILILCFAFIQIISLLLNASKVVNGVNLTESFISKIYNTFQAFYYFIVKFLAIQPNMFVVTIFLIFLIIGIYKKGGIILLLSLTLSIFVGCFLFANAPDFKMNDYSEILNYPFNTRSFPILILFLVSTFISINTILTDIENFQMKLNYRVYYTLFILLIIIFFSTRNYFFNEVNNSTLESTSVIESFREDLTKKSDLCLPVSPYGDWMYVLNKQDSCKIENKGRAYNPDKYIDLFGQKYIINIDKDISLKTILIPIKRIDNSFSNKKVKLILIDTDTNQVYEAYNNIHEKGFIAFNLTNLMRKKAYHFTLYSVTDNAYSFKFSDNEDEIVHYTYYKN